MSSDRLEAKKRALQENVDRISVSKNKSKIFSLSDKTSSLTKEKMMEISVDKITKSFEYQARLSFDKNVVKSIADSIESNGFLQNIIVVENGDGTYSIVAGETRLKAAREAQMPVIPALVYPHGTNIDKLIQLSVGENLNRKDIEPIELYILFSRILKEKKVRSYSDIYHYFNGTISLSKIKQVMAYQDIHPKILEDAIEGKYSTVSVIVKIRAVAKKILSLDEEKDIQSIYEEIILPVYEEIKNNSIPRDQAIDKLEKLIPKKEEKKLISFEKDKVSVNIKGMEKEKLEELKELLEDFEKRL